MLPQHIHVKNGALPDHPGVYLYFDRDGKILYVGKATSLKKRVGSYFVKAHEARIAEMVGKIARIDYIQVPTVIEALVLEANQIKARKPPYNVMLRDDKSFLYLTISNEAYPRPILMRGQEMEQMGINPFDKTLSAKAKKKFLRVFGPYTSSPALKKALALIRRSIPWSTCEPPEVTGRHRACFDAHIGRCPGVCTGAISKTDYRKIIRRLILFFDGKKSQLQSQLKKEMQAAAKAQHFEKAAKLRNHLYALEHIQDIALITREDFELPFSKVVSEGQIDLNGRIEAYDISNISGTSAVGSMVVFEDGRPSKDLYRKFRIKTVKGANDFAMMEEVLRRRLGRGAKPGKGWELPQVMVIDGGEGQVGRVLKVMQEIGVRVPVIGIAKGFDRKQDRLVYDRGDFELSRVATRGKELFQRARDEAHRFAVAYHRKLRGKKSIGQ
jgi:excinuclease ABC subunit C